MKLLLCAACGEPGQDDARGPRLWLIGKSTGTMRDIVDLTKDGLLENPNSLPEFLQKMENELKIGRTGSPDDLGLAAERARAGSRVSIGGRAQVAGDLESGKADVIDYPRRDANQNKTATSPTVRAVVDHIRKAIEQLNGVHGEVPPAGYQKRALIRVVNEKNSLFGANREVLVEQIRSGLEGTALPPGIVVEVRNGAPGSPFSITTEELGQ